MRFRETTLLALSQCTPAQDEHGVESDNFHVEFMSLGTIVQSLKRDNKANPSEFNAEAAYNKADKYEISKRYKYPIARRNGPQQGTTKTNMMLRQ